MFVCSTSYGFWAVLRRKTCVLEIRAALVRTGDFMPLALRKQTWGGGGGGEGHFWDIPGLPRLRFWGQGQAPGVGPLSSEALVHTSSLPRLIEPNLLLIFPQRAVSPTTSDAMLYLQLRPIRGLNSHSRCSVGGQPLITSCDVIIASCSCQAAQVSRRAD